MNGGSEPETQSVKDKSMSGLRLLLDDMATPDFELSDSLTVDGICGCSTTAADDIDACDHIGRSVGAITREIAEGLGDFLDENDLSDEQGAEMSDDEGFSTGWIRNDGMLL